METGWGKLVRGRLGMTKGDMFTPQQAAEITGLSKDKIRRDIGSGRMPATDVNGGFGRACWRMTRADISDYVSRIEANA